MMSTMSSGSGRKVRLPIIAVLVAIVALGVGLMALTRPPAPRGKFPANLSDTEKRQIVAAANHDALRHVLKALSHAQFSEARRWLVNSRKQTVRDIGKQGGEEIWVVFGFDEATATQGYAIWARYIMKREKGRWVIDTGPF
jgi:hypothetical protein